MEIGSDDELLLFFFFPTSKYLDLTHITCSNVGSLKITYIHLAAGTLETPSLSALVEVGQVFRKVERLLEQNLPENRAGLAGNTCAYNSSSLLYEFSFKERRW